MARISLSGAVAALVVAGAVAPLLVGRAHAGGVAGVGGVARPRAGEVVLLLVGGVSLEQVMGRPEFRQLARAGGAGLMTTRVGSGDRARAAYATIGAGSTASAGEGSRRLGNVLAAHAIGMCPGNRTGGLPVSILAASTPPAGSCFARSEPTRPGCPAGFSEFVGNNVVVLTASGAEVAGRLLRNALCGPPGLASLVLVVAPLPSRSMDGVGDEVTPILMLEGSRGAVLPANGPLHGVTSDSTRQDGLVSNVDVAPTILDFFGIPIPSQMDGRPIRTTDGPAPFDLHRRELQLRRIRFPVQMGELGFVVAGGAIILAALFLISRRRRLPARLAASLRFISLAAVSLVILVLAGGSLPRLTYAVVVPFLILGSLLLAALSLVARGRGPLGPFAFLGFVGLGFVVADLAAGGHAVRTPLLGGTMFDGVRYYGLPNAFIALVLASALFLAIRLEPLPGTVLLFASGLAMGFPALGANVGASVTLFAAAGLWWGLRTRHRLRLPEVAMAGAIALAGLAAVLLANRYLPGAPTHATALVERTGSHAGNIWHAIGDRLSVGVGQVRDVPAALIPLIGMLLVLWAAIAARGPIRWGLALGGRWRDVLVVMILAGVVAFVANDTGVAAAAPVFLYAVAGLAYPALLEETTAAAMPAKEAE